MKLTTQEKLAFNALYGKPELRAALAKRHRLQFWLALLLGHLMGGAGVFGAWLTTRMEPMPVPIALVSVASLAVFLPLFHAGERLAAGDPVPVWKPRRFGAWYCTAVVTVLQIMIATFPWHLHRLFE